MRNRIALASFALLLMLGCATTKRFADEDYSIADGYDFATGEDVSRKSYPNGKEVLTRYTGYSSLYKKYNLSHPEPILVFVCGTDYYRDQPAVCWDAWIVDHSFFKLLEEFAGLPQEEVKAIFEHSIALHKDEKYDEVSAYQEKEYARYEAQIPPPQRRINAFLEAPDSTYLNIFYGGNGNGEKRYFIEHREKFPELLPRPFYLYASSIDNTTPLAELAEFYRAEYRKYPTAMNAFLAAYVNLFSQEEEWFNKFDSRLGYFGHQKLFEEYHEAGILDTFLQTVMPKGLPPVMRESLHEQSGYANRYWNDLLALPRGETYLLWTAHAKTLKAHFREKFAEAYAERLSKEEAMKR